MERHLKKRINTNLTTNEDAGTCLNRGIFVSVSASRFTQNLFNAQLDKRPGRQTSSFMVRPNYSFLVAFRDDSSNTILYHIPR